MDNETYESVVICSHDGVNAVVNTATGLFDAYLSDTFFVHREEYGYTREEFENLPENEDEFILAYHAKMNKYAEQRAAKGVRRK